MLLTRFWVLVLCCMAITGIGAALLGRGIINRQSSEATSAALLRDRFGIESLLRLDARARLDALAPIAADGTIRQALRSGGEGRIDGQDGKKALKDRLRTLNQKLEELRADLLIGVDNKGLIIAQEGRREAREGAGLGRMPVVERALGGFIGDDVWVYDGEVYRVAARPVIDRGQFVGALVHAQKLDAKLAQRLSERLGGASVAFFFRDKVIAGYAPTEVPGAPTQTEIGGPLKAMLANASVQKGEASEPLEVGTRGRALYSLIAGSASASQVGYAVARPARVLSGPWAIFDETTKADVEGLPKTELGVGLALMLVLAMGTLYLERDRPLGILHSEATRLARGELDELDLAVLHGRYRKLGEEFNRALEVGIRNSGGQRKGHKANLDEILGPAPTPLTSSAFSFGSEHEREEPPTPVVPVVMPAPGARPAPIVAPPSVSAPTPALPRVPAPPPPRAAAKPAALTANAPAKAPAGRLSIPSPDDEVSVVSEVDAALREDPRDEEAVFREVFEQYIAMRTQCGESTADLTFEKFAVTLRKNRDRIVEQRPGTKQVRFTVYAKAGKAALRASPVKMS